MLVVIVISCASIARGDNSRVNGSDCVCCGCVYCCCVGFSYILMTLTISLVFEKYFPTEFSCLPIK